MTAEGPAVDAWQVTGPGEPPRLARRPPTPAGEGTSVVEIEAAQVSRLDLSVLDGALGPPGSYPFVPGTEGVGRVVDSSGRPAGARVRLRGAGVGIGGAGTWAERVTVPDAALHDVPEDVPAAVACAFFSPVATAIGAVEDVGAVAAGERVMVTGATGAVGAVAAQLAHRAGARVVGVASGPGSLDRLPPEVDEAVVADGLAPVAPVDLLVDTVGGPVLAAGLDLVRPGGRAVLVGYAAGAAVTVDVRRLIVSDVRLLPFNLVARGPRLVERADRLLPDVVAGRLRLEVATYGFADLPAARAAVEAGASGRRVVVVRDGSPTPEQAPNPLEGDGR